MAAWWDRVKSVFKDATEDLIDAIKWIKARPGFNRFLAAHGRQVAKIVVDTIRANPGRKFHELKEGVRVFLKEAYPDAPDNWIEGAIFFAVETFKATGKA